MKKMIIILLLCLITMGLLIGCNEITNQQSINLNSFCSLGNENYDVWEVKECNFNNQNMYSVSFAATDVPTNIYDSNKNLLFICGGMPFPGKIENNLCSEMSCNGRTHLCQN